MLAAETAKASSSYMALHDFQRWMSVKHAISWPCPALSTRDLCLSTPASITRHYEAKSPSYDYDKKASCIKENRRKVFAALCLFLDLPHSLAKLIKVKYWSTSHFHWELFCFEQRGEHWSGKTCVLPCKTTAHSPWFQGTWHAWLRQAATHILSLQWLI